MKFAEKFHWIRAVSFVSLLGIVGIIVVNEIIRNYFLTTTHEVLKWEPLYTFIVIFSFLIGCYYSYYFIKVNPDNKLLLFKLFGPLIDPPANTVTYGIVIASVLRLLRGIFCQFFFNEIYFKDFGAIDITAISFSCLVLLVWSVTGLVKYCMHVFVRSPTSLAKVEPINSQNES